VRPLWTNLQDRLGAARRDTPHDRSKAITVQDLLGPTRRDTPASRSKEIFAMGTTFSARGRHRHCGDVYESWLVRMLTLTLFSQGG
jgi:hypothetical protein